MLRRLYDRILALAEGRYALPALAAVSFIESSVFPITPLVMLIPMVLARPDRAWTIAGVCTLASVAGGVAGYGIGAFLFEEVGRPVLDLYGKAETFAEIAEWFNARGWEAVLIAAITPIPYKVVTIASGATGLSLGVLIAASLIGRAIQFFGVAAVLWWLGPPARVLIERHFAWVATLGGVLLVGGFVMVRYLA